MRYAIPVILVIVIIVVLVYGGALLARRRSWRPDVIERPDGSTEVLLVRGESRAPVRVLPPSSDPDPILRSVELNDALEEAEEMAKRLNR